MNTLCTTDCMNKTFRFFACKLVGDKNELQLNFKTWIGLRTISNRFSAKDVQRCTFGDSACIIAESNRVLHTHSKGHSGLNLIQVDPLHISEITLKQGTESPVNIELNFKEIDLLGLSGHNIYSITWVVWKENFCFCFIKSDFKVDFRRTVMANTK